MILSGRVLFPAGGHDDERDGKEVLDMSQKVSRVLWIIAGVFLIAAGIGCMRRPGEVIYSLPFIIGIAMMFSGIVDILIFATSHDCMAGSGWFLVDGILTVLLSLFILGNEWFTAITLPFIFGMWMIFSGITKFANSFDLQRMGVRGWGWFTAMGAILAVIGFLSFMHPFAGMAALAWAIGIFLILQGVVSVMRGCFVCRFWL